MVLRVLAIGMIALSVVVVIFLESSGF